MSDEELVEDMTREYTITQDRIAEMKEPKLSLEQELVTVNNSIASLQQEAQELGDVPSTVKETLADLMEARANLSGTWSY